MSNAAKSFDILIISKNDFVAVYLRNLRIGSYRSENNFVGHQKRSSK